MSAPIVRKSYPSMLHLFRRNIGQTYRFYASIKELLSHDVEKEMKVVAEGWLTSCRKQKHVTFFHVNDGSCLESLQVVAATKDCHSDLGIRSSVRVEGELVKSQASGQALEIQAKNIQLLGKCNLEAYPFKPRQKYTQSNIREHLHLRPRTDHFSSLLKVRNAATMAVHKFFQENDYLFIHTPIITSNDCEGAGETFNIQHNKQMNMTAEDSGSDSDPTERSSMKSDMFFSSQAYLTVSGQLHLEAITGRFMKAYNFGPTFRAENAVGRHHLSEFYMIEAEVAFVESLDPLIQVMEDLVKSVTRDVMSQCAEHVDVMRKTGSNDASEIVDSIANKRFESQGKFMPNRSYKQTVQTLNRQLLQELSDLGLHYLQGALKVVCMRLTYTEAVEILEKKNDRFKYKVSWGCDLQKEHEKYLVQHCGNTPVFVTDFPAAIKPFYARENSDSQTVAAVDLLAPGVGELIGGSLREERLDVLQTKMDNAKNLNWYLDLRRFGSVPHGGFGLGFERYLQCILGVPNIKDTIPFPRWSQHCDM